MCIYGGFTGKEETAWRSYSCWAWVWAGTSWHRAWSENPVCWGSGNSLNPNSHTGADWCRQCCCRCQFSVWKSQRVKGALICTFVLGSFTVVPREARSSWWHGKRDQIPQPLSRKAPSTSLVPMLRLQWRRMKGEASRGKENMTLQSWESSLVAQS